MKGFLVAVCFAVGSFSAACSKIEGENGTANIIIPPVNVGPSGNIPAVNIPPVDAGGGGGPRNPEIPGGGGGGTFSTAILRDLKELRSTVRGSMAELCNNPGGLQPPSCPIGIWLNKVAWDHRADGFVLSRKTSGHRVQSPAGEIAIDVLGRNGLACDIISDAENTAVVATSFGECGPAPRPAVNPVQP